MANSTTNIHEVDSIIIDAKWAQHTTEIRPYPVQTINFEYAEGDSHEITTFEPQGIIIKDWDKYQFDLQQDKFGKTRMHIMLKPPVLDEDGNLLEGITPGKH